MISVLRSNVVDLPVNVSLNYFWCSGFMISGFLGLQIITGVLLACIYLPSVLLSFDFVSSLVSEGLSIWVVRYAHLWGVSLIFILFMGHMGRALYYTSYSKFSVWNVGFILYILMMVEAFLGYTLPWHQMSYWAATVVLSVVQSVPIVGDVLFFYLTAGGTAGLLDSAIMRFFIIHMVLGFVIVYFAVIHLFYLHKSGSNNPLWVHNSYGDVVLFHSSYTMKDAFMYCLILWFLCVLLFVFPDLVLDEESFREADPSVTPVNIKPEWYFLAYYAMLRSVESKTGGICLVLLFLFLLWLPTLNTSCAYSVSRQVLFWVLCALFCFLTYLGGCHPEYPYIVFSKVASYGIVFLLLLYKGLWTTSYVFVLGPGVGIPGLRKYLFGDVH